jgi:hypothetical protein
MIGQRVQVGLRYAGQIVTIEVDETTLRVYDQRDYLIKTVPRTSRREVRRHKAYGHQPQNRLGTVTHHLTPKTAPIIKTRAEERRLSDSQFSQDRKCDPDPDTGYLTPTSGVSGLCVVCSRSWYAPVRDLRIPGDADEGVDSGAKGRIEG